MKYIDDIDIKCNKKTKQLFYKMLLENCLNENVYIIHKNSKQYQTYQSILILDRLSDNLIEEYDYGDYVDVVVSDKDLPFDNNYEFSLITDYEQVFMDLMANMEYYRFYDSQSSIKDFCRKHHIKFIEK